MYKLWGGCGVSGTHALIKDSCDIDIFDSMLKYLKTQKKK